METIGITGIVHELFVVKIVPLLKRKLIGYSVRNVKNGYNQICVGLSDREYDKVIVLS